MGKARSRISAISSMPGKREMLTAEINETYLLGEAQKCLRERLQARDNNTLPALRRGQDLAFGEWADFYLENFSKPPFRAPNPCGQQRALKHPRSMFEETKLAGLTVDNIETYLRRRLKQRMMVKAKDGFVQKGVLKATMV